MSAQATISTSTLPEARTFVGSSVEVFTGAGGLALATHHAGFRHRALIEWNRDACETLRANAALGSIRGIGDWHVLEADARLVPFGSFGPVDLVAGGPPCQPFSIGGKHAGMQDQRDMIPQFVRAVRELTPKAFILENVKGLLRESFKTYFSYTLLQLAHPEVVPHRGEDWLQHLGRLEDCHTHGSNGLSYNVVFRLLNAADYGVPQTRERVFIVGFRQDTKIEWHFPEPTHSRTDLVHQQNSGAYWEEHGIACPSGDPRESGASALSLLPLRRWRTVRDAIADLPEPSLHSAHLTVPNHVLRVGARRYKGHTGSLLDWPSKTLKAGDHGVPGGENMIAFPDGTVRYMSVREAARIQTFPDAWRFQGPWSEAMRQLGNAVPVQLASVVASSVASALDVHSS